MPRVEEEEEEKEKETGETGERESSARMAWLTFQKLFENPSVFWRGVVWLCCVLLLLLLPMTETSMPGSEEKEKKCYQNRKIKKNIVSKHI